MVSLEFRQDLPHRRIAPPFLALQEELEVFFPPFFRQQGEGHPICSLSKGNPTMRSLRIPRPLFA